MASVENKTHVHLFDFMLLIYSYKWKIYIFSKHQLCTVSNCNLKSTFAQNSIYNIYLAERKIVGVFFSREIAHKSHCLLK